MEGMALPRSEEGILAGSSSPDQLAGIVRAMQANACLDIWRRRIPHVTRCCCYLLMGLWMHKQQILCFAIPHLMQVEQVLLLPLGLANKRHDALEKYSTSKAQHMGELLFVVRMRRLKIVRLQIPLGPLGMYAGCAVLRQIPIAQRVW